MGCCQDLSLPAASPACADGGSQGRPALGQVTWDTGTVGRSISSGIASAEGAQGASPVEWRVRWQLPAARGVVAPGGTDCDGAGFSPLPVRAGLGPNCHHGPLHRHDTAVSHDLCGRGFLPHPQDPLPHQNEDPLLEQLRPYGELGCQDLGGTTPGSQGSPGRRGSVPSWHLPQVVSVVSCFGLWIPRSMMVVEMATTA